MCCGKFQNCKLAVSLGYSRDGLAQNVASCTGLDCSGLLAGWGRTIFSSPDSSAYNRNGGPDGAIRTEIIDLPCAPWRSDASGRADVDDIRLRLYMSFSVSFAQCSQCLLLKPFYPPNNCKNFRVRIEEPLPERLAEGRPCVIRAVSNLQRPLTP